MSDAGGMKFDAGKARYDLVPLGPLRGVAEVLTYGAEKYAAHSWQTVPDALPRYIAAMHRHLNAVLVDAEVLDAESGLRHAWHFLTNAFFVAWLLVYRSEQVTRFNQAHSGRQEQLP